MCHVVKRDFENTPPALSPRGVGDVPPLLRSPFSAHCPPRRKAAYALPAPRHRTANTTQSRDTSSRGWQTDTHDMSAIESSSSRRTEISRQRRVGLLIYEAQKLSRVCVAKMVFRPFRQCQWRGRTGSGLLQLPQCHGGTEISFVSAASARMLCLYWPGLPSIGLKSRLQERHERRQQPACAIFLPLTTEGGRRPCSAMCAHFG